MKKRNLLELKIQKYIKNVLLEHFGLPLNTLYKIEDTIISNYNINHVIQLVHKRYVLRLNVEKQSGLSHQIEYEYKTLEYLADYGIVPKPYLVDNTKRWLPFGFLVQEYLPGKHLDYDEIEGIGEAAAVLATLHRIALPTEKFLIMWDDPLKDSLKEITRMLSGYAERKSRDRELVKAGSKLQKKLEVSADINGKHFKAVSIIHTDVVNDNFIRSPEGIKIIDWEKPRIDDGTYDVCVFLGKPPQIWGASRLMDKGEREYFIHKYCRSGGYEQGEIEEKVRIRQPFVSFRWVLWGAHRTADFDEGMISSELGEFHSINYKRYKQTASVENIERLMEVVI